jgi:hypothetical protein
MEEKEEKGAEHPRNSRGIRVEWYLSLDINTLFQSQITSSSN